MVEKERKQEFDDGWVTTLDVSPFLQTREFIESLTSWCGGLDEEEEYLFN